MATQQSEKRTIKVSIDSELLDEARRIDVDLSEILERELRNLIRATQEQRQRQETASPSEQQRRWREENQEAIASINVFIDQHGLLADHLRLRPEDE